MLSRAAASSPSCPTTLLSPHPQRNGVLARVFRLGLLTCDLCRPCYPVTVFICISLMSNHVGCLFIGRCAFVLSSLGMCLFTSFQFSNFMARFFTVEF